VGLTRSTPLRRFTALVARTPLIRKTPLKPGRGDEIPAATRRAVKRRSEGSCEVCGCGGADHMHHRKLRSQGVDHSPANLLHVHFGCHKEIHGNPERSYALGHLVHGWADPASVPVQPLPRIRSL